MKMFSVFRGREFSDSSFWAVAGCGVLGGYKGFLGDFEVM
jgi:hypothetical protein